MEEPTTPQPQYRPATPARFQSASLLKIVVPIVVVGFILLLIYTFLSGLRTAQKAISTTATPAPTTSATTTTSTSKVQSSLVSGSNGIRTLHAGMQSGTFLPYALNLSEGWTETSEQDASVPSDKLVLTKDNYSITILQEAGVSGTCLFPTDTGTAENGQRFTSYVGIPGLTSTYRRATSDNKTYTICEKKGNVYGYPTTFGNITYSVPASVDPKILNEMDAMVASLNK